MADTTFTNGGAPVDASWLNDVNDFVYTDGVTKNGVQTLTNKTVTSPTINGGTVNNATSITAVSGGVGYATGAGGTVIQGTSKATTVSLSKLCGTVTIHSASLAANTNVSFTFTNTTIAAADTILFTHISGGTIGAYAVFGAAAAGSATVTMRNLTGGALVETTVWRFIVLKAVVA